MAGCQVNTGSSPGNPVNPFPQAMENTLARATSLAHGDTSLGATRAA
jgi:hypothetical protein